MPQSIGMLCNWLVMIARFDVLTLDDLQLVKLGFLVKLVEFIGLPSSFGKSFWRRKQSQRWHACTMVRYVYCC